MQHGNYAPLVKSHYEHHSNDFFFFVIDILHYLIHRNLSQFICLYLPHLYDTADVMHRFTHSEKWSP